MYSQCLSLVNMTFDVAREQEKIATKIRKQRRQRFLQEKRVKQMAPEILPYENSQCARALGNIDKRFLATNSLVTQLLRLD